MNRMTEHRKTFGEWGASMSESETGSNFNASPTDESSSHHTTRPDGYLSFTLHAHLPYVINHGTWPHGIEWLHEAAAETYLPLLRVLRRLEADGIALHCNLVLSPILLEQLAHPVFRTEFPKYIERKVLAAREDEAYFHSTGEDHYAETARFWESFFSEALNDFEALGRDIAGGFLHFHRKGTIDIVTGGASHGYLPLLGTDESVRAQVRLAVQTHQHHLGERPKGMWIPECGYRAAGFWDFPVGDQDGRQIGPGSERIGIEQALGESDLEFFFVDTHLAQEGVTQHRSGQYPQHDNHRLFQPYCVAGESDGICNPAVFPRDPRSGAQVWSTESGYPGDPEYLDFHKKRWPGGHRYWRVTGAGVDMNDKQPYTAYNAAERAKVHASHFVDVVWRSLQPSFGDPTPPIFCSPFDAELFGHWWFEGALWLEAVARVLHDHPCGLELTTCSAYLANHPPNGLIRMREGSWGANGTDHVWLNQETSWTYTRLYPAELYLREVCTAARWRESELGERIVKQLCRELLLLESSDWQFLITTGAARDYAEQRFQTHSDQFTELKVIWQIYEGTRQLSDDQLARLSAIEERDSIFPQIDPAMWATGARETGYKRCDTSRDATEGVLV
jgi:1,4-alpha-glucan branching enzyme